MIADGLTQQSADVTGTFCTVPIARADQLFSTLGYSVILASAINVSIHNFKAAKAADARRRFVGHGQSKSCEDAAACLALVDLNTAKAA